jgi:hypothetical protein
MVTFLFHETAVVAVPARHPLAGLDRVSSKTWQISR